MSGRIKLLLQKRTTLKSQISNVNNLLDKGKLDNATLRLRIARLTELYHAFEDYNDELAVAEPDAGHQDEFTNLQERFYSLAGKAENIMSKASISNVDTSSRDGTSNDETRRGNQTVLTPIAKRRMRLPEPPLPTFDGKYENWLSFKNAFHSMIGSQTDLTDIDKLHYLKSALIGEASNKIKILAVDGINYSKAWELLERSYEVKRVLISRHLSMILNMSAFDKESSSSLARLADDTQQHIASLSALGVSVGSEMIVHIIESKLPRVTLERWEVSLERDEYPTPDQMYEFLYKSAVCASRRERARSFEREKDRFEPLIKRKRNYASNQTFLLSAPRNGCVVCKNRRHPLYLCDGFKRMPVPKRIETVKIAKLCFNCLRSHRDSPCTFSSCTICQKRHNTLLHWDRHASLSGRETSKTAAATSE